jgi:hypothetical protein
MAIDAAEAKEQGAFKSRAESFTRQERYASATSGLSAALERLASPEMLTHVLRSAAHAGAIVMYNELHAKVPVEKGVLKESLFRWFNTKQSTPTVQRYLVGPNKQEAGHWANVEFGHWRYNRSLGKGKWARSKIAKGQIGKTKNTKGQSHGGKGALDKAVWVPPTPYLRPAWEAKKAVVGKVMRSRAGVRLRELLAGKS